MRNMDTLLMWSHRLKILEACHWNRTQAAEILGLNYRTITRWIQLLAQAGYMLPVGEFNGGRVARPDAKTDEVDALMVEAVETLNKWRLK